MITLNPEQEEVVNFEKGILSVVAIPGSGKTQSMVMHICALIQKYNQAPESILALTFTKTAALTMKQRLHDILGDKAKRVLLMTLHSWCLHIQKREKVKFEVLAVEDQMRMLKRIIQKKRIKNISAGGILREINISNNNLISIDDYRGLYAQDDTMQKVADVWEKYSEEKSDKMLKDFDDLLISTIHLFNSDKEVLEKYRSIYTSICWDEYQDSTIAQQTILKQLVDEKTISSLWVCFDDAQSIFGWNGASVRNVLNFKDDFPTAQQVILSRNYRSTPQIIQACENIIKHNEKQIQKEFIPVKESGEEIIVLEAENEEDEARIIVEEVHDLVKNEYSHKDIAVLFRANFQVRILQEYFSRANIPYKLDKKSGNFYTKKEIRILLDYLRFITEPDSEVLLKILNVPTRYIGKRFIRQLEEYADDKEIPLLQALKEMPISISYVKENVSNFISVVGGLFNIAHKTKPRDMLEMLREALDYDSFITETEISEVDDSRIENLEQLMLASAKFSDIKAFIEYADTFKDESGDDENGVSLKTVHSAKGEEYSVVFCIGMVMGVMPSSKNQMENIEEERRIAYTAISRAKDLLYLSYSKEYLRQPCKRSIFISEILGYT
ncbi:ATP-dependent helicase [candidate division KSB1 bacterium]